ncbi:hypothetical protein AXK11_07285 [Cephaloticoccus primus]|uniref:Uncharacterized protein n=1 Tax=Cephaloticoccus primus TaxID=1548207 RepID=A0A139SKR4_9BACT|nr:hypothetical protein [Cephaloticoccus primus]KXU35145.1 hypothetical protein AXK11_07285 [Cephaloticoccus primus]
MKLRSLLIIAPGALLLIAALAFVFVNKDDGHGHDHSHGAHGHSHSHNDHDHSAGAHSHGTASTAANPGELDHSADWGSVFGKAALPQTWKSITTASENARVALDRADLARVPDLAETIHLGAHALYDQLDTIQRIGEIDTTRLRAALAQLALLADDLLDHAQHGDLARARSTYARLSSAIGVTAIRLPVPLLDAAATSLHPPLTATASAHSHDHTH